MVCPTISGKIVECRDQVLTICFWPDSFIAATRFISRSSAHGPFFVQRPISSLTLAPPARPHDQRVRLLALLAGAVTERGLAPWRDRVAARRVVGLATAVGVVHRVHRDPAGLRALALVTVAARLADL